MTVSPDLGGLIDRLKAVVRNIVDGHQARIANCGLDYMPPSLMVGPDLPDADWQKFRAAVETKIAPNQATVDLLGSFQLNFGPESRAAILAALHNQRVANLHFLEPSVSGSRNRALRARHEVSVQRVGKT